MSTDTLTTGRKAFLHGVFTTALEGGIGYWSECSDYHWCNDDDTDALDGFYAVIHPPYDRFADEQMGWGIFADKESGDTPEDLAPLRIDLNVMAHGAKLMNWFVQGLIDGDGKQVPLDQIKPWRDDHYYWQYVQAYNSNGQDGDYDAGVADMVVQFGLFGSVVYG